MNQWKKVAWWLHVFDRKLAFPGELLRLLPRHPLGGLLEPDIRIVCVRDPDRPIDLAFDLLRLRFPEDDSSTTNLDRLLGLLGLVGRDGGRARRNQRMIEAYLPDARESTGRRPV